MEEDVAPNTDCINFQSSWDSGVALDSNTAMQISEFQDVVDNLQTTLSETQVSPCLGLSFPPMKVTQSSTNLNSDKKQILGATKEVLHCGIKTFPHRLSNSGNLNDDSRCVPNYYDQAPNIIERVGENYAIATRPPTFKQSTASNRTHMRQLLSREQCMQRENRSELQSNQSKADVVNMKVDMSLQVDEIPSEVFKIETRLENPTKYHVLESQRRQVAEYLSGPPSSPQILQLQAGSITTALAPMAMQPFSPTCSSTTTSPSETCEDFLDEILSQGEGTCIGVPTENTMFDQLVKEEPLGEEELKALQKDRMKKDNHNMIERRRRFNINDRIKELGMLLPKQSQQYYEIVKDVRHNKGSILKASVDYIKILKREKERKATIEEEFKQTKQQNRKLQLQIQEYEEKLSAAGFKIDQSSSSKLQPPSVDCFFENQEPEHRCQHQKEYPKSDGSSLNSSIQLIRKDGITLNPLNPDFSTYNSAIDGMDMA